jgi:hypothetical protein
MHQHRAREARGGCQAFARKQEEAGPGEQAEEGACRFERTRAPENLDGHHEKQRQRQLIAGD